MDPFVFAMLGWGLTGLFWALNPEPTSHWVPASYAIIIAVENLARVLDGRARRERERLACRRQVK